LKQRILTGITTTGSPHLGNYLGAIKPAVMYSQDKTVDSFYFLADYHALVKCRDPEVLEGSVREIAATWLACGLDTDHAIFYRQSDVPEILELSWILASLTAKGLMNRAHAYKALTDKNAEEGEDPDHAISMGLFSYPLLMAADILMFNATKVPVGADQLQHIEMTRDIAQRFNHHYGKYFSLPEAEISKDRQTLTGLDGRKMSKSYGNTVPLFCDRDSLRKLIMRMKTDSLPPEAPKQTEGCTLFEMYSAFAGPKQKMAMIKRYQEGVGWGEVKEALFVLLDELLSPLRVRYEEIASDSVYLAQVLATGAQRAREHSSALLEKVRDAVGIRALA
jgi:tryptophanyl-tRNA synthetase